MGGGRFLRNDDDTAGFPKLTPKSLKHIHLELGDDYKSGLISFLFFVPVTSFGYWAGARIKVVMLAAMRSALRAICAVGV